MRTLLMLVLGALIVGVAASSPSRSSVPDRIEKFPALGFGFERSVRLEARQVPPESEGLLLLFATKNAPNDRAAPCTHRVYRIEGPVVDVTALRAWVQRIFPTADVAQERSVRERYGRSPLRLTGQFVVENQERGLFVHAWTGPEDAVVFVGECEESLYRRERRAFDRAASSFRFFDQAEVDLSRKQWEARYRRTVLPFEAARIEVGAKLATGWTVTDTKSAMVLFHGPEHSTVPRQLADAMMAVRSRLRVDLPPDQEVSSLAVVRICRDRGEYLTYGGSPATAGYFNPNVGELVLYDARTKPEGPIPLDHPTARTLYHEVCHQFLHQTMSAATPHSWFGEGLAEYYAGATFRSGRVVGVDPLEDKLEYLMRPDVRAQVPPLGDLLAMSQSAFYGNAAVCYPFSYALVRFLETSSEARGRRPWREVVERYHEGLRAAWRDEVEELALRGVSRQSYDVAVRRSKERALGAAFEEVDVPELERALWSWIARGEG